MVLEIRLLELGTRDGRTLLALLFQVSSLMWHWEKPTKKQFKQVPIVASIAFNILAVLCREKFPRATEFRSFDFRCFTESWIKVQKKERKKERRKKERKKERKKFLLDGHSQTNLRRVRLLFPHRKISLLVLASLDHQVNPLLPFSIAGVWSCNPRGLNERQHAKNNLMAISVKYLSGNISTIKAKAEFSVVSPISAASPRAMIGDTQIIRRLFDGWVRCLFEKNSSMGVISILIWVICWPTIVFAWMSEWSSSMREEWSTRTKGQASSSSGGQPSSSRFSTATDRHTSLESFSGQLKSLLDDERCTDVNIHVLPKAVSCRWSKSISSEQQWNTTSLNCVIWWNRRCWRSTTSSRCWKSLTSSQWPSEWSLVETSRLPVHPFQCFVRIEDPSHKSPQHWSIKLNRWWFRSGSLICWYIRCLFLADFFRTLHRANHTPSLIVHDNQVQDLWLCGT